jgi:hypothetical protein
MKISRRYLEAAAFIAVYLFTLYLWTLPFQDNQTPYGEFDAISHWEIADYFAQEDRTFNALPPFLDFSYGDDNRFRPHTLWYHPTFHTGLAISSSIAGGGMVPVYLTNAIFASSILISLFFVIRKLYGFLPAILSSFLLTFSMRDIWPYLWGQWPERFAYAFIPLALYCFYTYFTYHVKGEHKPIYLHLTSLFLVINLLIHPLVFFHSVTGLAILSLLLFAKYRTFPFAIRHIAFSALVFIALFSLFPSQSGNVIISFTQGSSDDKDVPLSRLFDWGPNPDNFKGSVPAEYFSFGIMHGWWTLPFLLIGIIALLLRRESKDLFMLAWLISLYLILHRDLIGSSTFLHRSLSASAHIFVPITIIGLLSLVSIAALPSLYRSLLRHGCAIAVVFLTILYNMPLAHSTLEQAYDNPLIRPNPAQIEMSEWVRENVPEDKNVSVMGPPEQIMQKVWWMSSYSHRTSQFFEGFLRWKTFAENRNETIASHLMNDYIVLDYSDIARIQDQSFVQQWQQFEQQNLAGHKLLYNKDNIKVYHYGQST